MIAKGTKPEFKVGPKVSCYLEGDTRGDEKKDKGEEEENLEPVGGEPDIPNLQWNSFSLGSQPQFVFCMQTSPSNIIGPLYCIMPIVK